MGLINRRDCVEFYIIVWGWSYKGIACSKGFTLPTLTRFHSAIDSSVSIDCYVCIVRTRIE